ncbi:MAG: CBS domain-containing protein [Planctomycetota bacterium]|nr:MAG: CBS domain-containing protein [Planctomycetota bacterium]REJ96747.1 MAG: CBS domain-containing protein [Planctomycetota bacterium]REK25157.1 MAG: CBS domain-containing protein [Planctomycetota bacterium]REK38798.1 MAG: CBS domain-containing protein [Planctomycetota bacterium]
MSERKPPAASDFMNCHVHLVSPDMSLGDVIQFLIRHEISNAPVVETDNGRNKLVGFISERDCLAVLAGVSYFGSPSPPQTVRTIMRLHPVCVSPQTELFTLASIFVNHGFRHLPVVEDEALLGIVSRRDILRAMDEYYRETQGEQSHRKFFRPDLHEIANHRFITGGF